MIRIYWIYLEYMDEAATPDLSFPKMLGCADAGAPRRRKQRASAGLRSVNSGQVPKTCYNSLHFPLGTSAPGTSKENASAEGRKLKHTIAFPGLTIWKDAFVWGCWCWDGCRLPLPYLKALVVLQARSMVSYWCPGLQQFAMSLHLDCIWLTPGLCHGSSYCQEPQQKPGSQISKRPRALVWYDGQWGNWQVPGGPSAVETSGLPASYDGRELCSEVVVATKSFHNFRRWIARQCWTKLFAQVVATAVVLAILYFGTRNPCPWLVYCFVGDGSRDVGQVQRLLGDFGDTNIVWALMWYMYEMSISCECPSEILLRVWCRRQ